VPQRGVRAFAYYPANLLRSPRPTLVFGADRDTERGPPGRHPFCQPELRRSLVLGLAFLRQDLIYGPNLLERIPLGWNQGGGQARQSPAIPAPGQSAKTPTDE
jgi:hypothetical protein